MEKRFDFGPGICMDMGDFTESLKRRLINHEEIERFDKWASTISVTPELDSPIGRLDLSKQTYGDMVNKGLLEYQLSVALAYRDALPVTQSAAVKGLAAKFREKIEYTSYHLLYDVLPRRSMYLEALHLFTINWVTDLVANHKFRSLMIVSAFKHRYVFTICYPAQRQFFAPVQDWVFQTISTTHKGVLAAPYNLRFFFRDTRGQGKTLRGEIPHPV